MYNKYYVVVTKCNEYVISFNIRIDSIDSNERDKRRTDNEIKKTNK